MNRVLRYILLLALLLVSACAEEQPLPPGDPTPTRVLATPTEAPRGGNLTVRLAQDVPVLRPWAPGSVGEEQLIALLYRGLTRLDSRLEPEPDLAEAWSVDQFGETMTMTLRANATWHDGQPLTAEDARWTIQALRGLAQPIAITTTQTTTPTTILSGTSPLISDLYRVVADVQAPTSTTLVLRLTEPYAPLLSVLSIPVLPKHRLEGRTPQQLAELNFWDDPIGSGPFKLGNRIPEQSILLERYAGFYSGAPYLDRVAFVVAPDEEVAQEALRRGELLLAEVPWESSGVFSDSEELAETIRLGTFPENGYYFVAFNLRAERPFADPRLREALALSFDLPAAVADVTAGRGTPLGSDLLPGLWPGDGPPPAPYNPDRGRQLLEEAGWLLPEGESIRQREGITLTAELLVSADDERRIALARRLADGAREIGMDMVVTPADFATTLRSKLLFPFDFDLMLMGWINSRVDPGRPSYMAYDPDNFPLFHSSQIYQGLADGRPGMRNFVAYDDESFDNQVQAARSLYNIDQRKTIYPELAAILAQGRPYLFLWADRNAVVLSNRVRSTAGPIELNSPNYLYGVETWYLEE